MRILSLLVLAIISISISCTKISSTDIGNGLIPAVDNVNTFDTLLEVSANTVNNNFDPTVYKGDDHVIGVLNDPIFGTTRATTFLELKPTIYPYTFAIDPINRVADSAVLILNFRGLYGDTTMTAPQQNWEVVELSEELKGDSSYKTSVNPLVGDVISEATNINVRTLKDSVKNRFEKSVNQVRIKLKFSFAKRLIEDYGPTNAYLKDSAFRANFKGFAVRPTSNSNGNTLVRVNLLDPDTKLGLYFHKDSSGVKSDTSVNFFRFSIFTGETSSSANRIVRNYIGSELGNAYNTPNSPKVYVLTSPGTYVNVTIPGLNNLSNRIIHRAELLTFQDDADNDPLADKLLPPRYLLLARYDSAFKGLTNVPNDYEVTQSGSNIQSFGGYLFYQNLAGFTKQVAAYSFNISRYVQGIVTRKEAVYPLRILAPSNDSLKYRLPYPNSAIAITSFIAPSNSNRMAEGRVRLGGGSNTNSRIRMRVRIIFSRL